jgi:hypothetical protein
MTKFHWILFAAQKNCFGQVFTVGFIATSQICLRPSKSQTTIETAHADGALI